MKTGLSDCSFCFCVIRNPHLLKAPVSRIERLILNNNLYYKYPVEMCQKRHSKRLQQLWRNAVACRSVIKHLTCSQRQWLHSSVGRASHRYLEVTGSSPVEVLIFFSGFFTQLYKLRSLRRAFLHFHKIDGRTENPFIHCLQCASVPLGWWKLSIMKGHH